MATPITTPRTTPRTLKARVRRHILDVDLTLDLDHTPVTVLFGPSGAGKTTLLRVVLPMSKAGLATAAVLTFAHTVGEFGVVLMVGGNIPGQTRTVSIAIYDSVQAFDYTLAAHTSLAMLGFSVLVLTAVYSLQRRRGTQWPHP